MDITNNVASIIGNTGVGYIIQYLGYFWAFGISSVLFLVGLVYVVCVLSETVDRKLDSRFLSLGHVRRACMLYVRDDGNDRRWKLQVRAKFICDAKYWPLGQITYIWSKILNLPPSTHEMSGVFFAGGGEELINYGNFFTSDFITLNYTPSLPVNLT